MNHQDIELNLNTQSHFSQLANSPVTGHGKSKSFYALRKWKLRVRVWEDGSVMFLNLEDDTGTVFHHLS